MTAVADPAVAAASDDEGEDEELSAAHHLPLIRRRCLDVTPLGAAVEPNCERFNRPHKRGSSSVSHAREDYVRSEFVTHTARS